MTVWQRKGRRTVDAEQVRRLMTDAVPFNRVLGVQVAAVESERVEVTLPESPERLNHVGTVHAAVQFGIGEAAAGAMVVAAFGDLEGVVPLVANASIRYRAPARGRLRGVAQLAQEQQTLVRDELQRSGRARVTVPVRLLDDSGQSVADMEVFWALITS